MNGDDRFKAYDAELLELGALIEQMRLAIDARLEALEAGAGETRELLTRAVANLTQGQLALAAEIGRSRLATPPKPAAPANGTKPAEGGAPAKVAETKAAEAKPAGAKGGEAPAGGKEAVVIEPPKSAPEAEERPRRKRLYRHLVGLHPDDPRSRR
jgi:hypothetical protein